VSSPTIERNRRVVLRSYLAGRNTNGVFEVVDDAVPTANTGEFLIRIAAVSVDPAMRTWASQNPGRYAPVPLGSVLPAIAVGTVASSEHPDFAPGDCVVGRFGAQEWAVSDGSNVVRRFHNSPDPITLALGTLGHIGMTAIIGMVEVAHAQAGETVVVSSAAGAVGAVAGQVAKLLGCRTIGIAGGPKKVSLCRDVYGYDAAIDYQASADLTADLMLAAPEGFDVFFDNVGGRIFDAVMPLMNPMGRVAICGTIGVDSAAPGNGPRWERRILERQLTIRGFLESRFDCDRDALFAQLSQWQRDGLITLHEDVRHGIESAPEAIDSVLNGNNFGKCLISVNQ